MTDGRARGVRRRMLSFGAMQRPEVAVRFVVRGRVQGVGFRFFVRRRARQAALRGWVRNRSDGAVEVEVVGAEAAVAGFRETLRTGPAGAAVSALEEESLTQPPGEASFEVRLP